VKYCSQALEREPENDKALYRRGLAYIGTGKINEAKADLLRAHDLTGGKDPNVIKGL
jgi:tetratricopeptide (TPR) repeat protein